MEIHIKTLKITLAIAVITLCLALIMGLKYSKMPRNLICVVSLGQHGKISYLGFLEALFLQR